MALSSANIQGPGHRPTTPDCCSHFTHGKPSHPKGKWLVHPTAATAVSWAPAKTESGEGMGGIGQALKSLPSPMDAADTMCSACHKEGHSLFQGTGGRTSGLLCYSQPKFPRPLDLQCKARPVRRETRKVFPAVPLPWPAMRPGDPAAFPANPRGRGRMGGPVCPAAAGTAGRECQWSASDSQCPYLAPSLEIQKAYSVACGPRDQTWSVP